MGEDSESNSKGFAGLSSMISTVETIESVDEPIEGTDEVHRDPDIDEVENISSSSQIENSRNKVKTVLVACSILIIGIAASYYGYNSYFNNPEKIVKEFYQAYFNREVDKVAQNLSVFWAVRFLPEYENTSPVELLAARAEIEGKIASVIADIEKENQLPEGLSIEIMPDYTKVGKESGIVVYRFKEKGVETSKEAAILIRENGQFRIFNMSAVDASVLSQIKSLDMNILDQNFTELKSTTSAK